MFNFSWFMDTAFPLLGNIFGFFSYIGSLTVGDFLDFIQGIFLIDHTIEFTNIFTGNAVYLTVNAFYFVASSPILDLSLAPLKAFLGVALSLFSYFARGVVFMFPFLELSSPLWFAFIFIAFYISLALGVVSWALKLFVIPS